MGLTVLTHQKLLYRIPGSPLNLVYDPFLSELLERLCLSLYDVLRPLIIHVIHLETLSELCGILKNEMLEDHVQNNGDSNGVAQMPAVLWLISDLMLWSLM